MRDFVGRRELVLFIGAALVTLVVSAINKTLPVNIMPNLALCPVIGLLFGPFASLGVNLVSFFDNITSGSPPAYCVIDLLTVFLVSYIPYRLWYSTGTRGDNRPPVLDSVTNIARFVLMMLVSSLTYTVLYNITYGIIDGRFVLDFGDLVRFINVMSFSFLFGLSAILLLRYLGVKFYTPKYGGTPDDFRRVPDPHLYDMLLVMGLVLPAVLLNYTEDGTAIKIMAIITYVLLIAFLLKPIEQAHTDENTTVFGKIRLNKFNRSLIERIIVIFIIYGILICLLAGLAASLGILEDVFGWGYEVTVLFYMSFGLLIFFIPALVFLWYIERTVTVPISAITEASKNFISDDHDVSGEEFSYSCRDYIDKDSEIGELARALTEMTGDMERYVEDIRTLNSQQEKYRAELNVAQNIQESFVPRNFSIVDGTGVSVAGSMTSAKYVGGDFYDFFMIDTDHIGLAIGDVSGKGVPAALYMAVTKSLLEGQTRPGLGPEEVLGKVNINLCRSNDESMFVTAWIGILELGTGRLRFSSAGHNPPVFVRNGGEPELLTTKVGLVLGAREGVPYTSSEIVMEPGDRVLLYTDGVTEANDHFNGFYGTERLMERMKENSELTLEEQVAGIKDDIGEFTNHATQYDDITMLLFRYEGAPKSGKGLLDREYVPPAVAPVGDTVDVLLDKEDSQPANGSV